MAPPPPLDPSQGSEPFPPTHTPGGSQLAYREGRQLAVPLPAERPRLPQPAACSLAGSSGGGTRPTQPFTVAQPAGARVPSPGSALRQGRPRLQPPGLCARERVSSKLEPPSAAVPDSSARCGRAQMPGPPPRLRQRSMHTSPAPAPAQAVGVRMICGTTDLQGAITSWYPYS